jgi:hypothetical protein
MQAFEFEINAKRNFIEIPAQYNQIYSKTYSCYKLDLLLTT